MRKKEIYKKITINTLERYQKRYYEMGETPKTLGWGCREDQLERFEVMCENYDFNGKTVMDIGCGFADWYCFLQSKNITCNYIGVDIIPEFIECCKNKFKDAVFINADIMLEAHKLPTADVVLTNGTLNFNQSFIDNLVYTEDFMKIAFSKTEDVVIMDFLSTFRTPSYPKEDVVYYHDPKQVLDTAFKYSNNLKLLHNYRAIPQKEFMLFLYK